MFKTNHYLPDPSTPWIYVHTFMLLFHQCNPFKRKPNKVTTRIVDVIIRIIQALRFCQHRHDRVRTTYMSTHITYSTRVAHHVHSAIHREARLTRPPLSSDFRASITPLLPPSAVTTSAPLLTALAVFLVMLLLLPLMLLLTVFSIRSGTSGIGNLHSFKHFLSGDSQ